MRILITGGTGFVGQLLTEKIKQRGDEVVLITRRDVPSGGQPMSPEKLAGVDAIVNMAGESIAGARWTESYKKKIYDSRIPLTRALVDACISAKKDGRSVPKSLVSISAVGVFGTHPTADFTEESPVGPGWLASVARDWETEAARVSEADVRLVILRLGVVLGAGGFLARLKTPFQMFVGGPVGGGEQWVSWIHREDVVTLILKAIDEGAMKGNYNVTAPAPVTNRELSAAIGAALGRPSWLSAPPFALRLLFGEMADELILRGQRALPERLRKSGYVYKHSELREAVVEAFSKT